VIYFDNAYRALGLYDNATRSEVRSVFHQLKIRSKVAAGAGPADPLALLAPVDRSEEALRDAFNALGNVSERLRQRLFWFSKSTSRDSYALDCISSGDFTGAVEAWGSAGEPSSRANLARLYHMLMIARDVLPKGGDDREGPAIPEKYTWVDAMRVWREVIESDRFWEEFAALERACGFEPPAFGSDIASLRGRAWESLLQPSLLLLAGMVERKEYGKARDHIEDLRDADLPAPRIAELEKESFVPVISAVDAVVDDITTTLEKSLVNHRSLRAAYMRYRKEALPFLGDMLKEAGFNFEPTRQLCETCSDFLRHLTQRASDANEIPFAIALQNEANAVLKGGIEEAPERESSTVDADYSGTTTERRSGRTIPGWVVFKIILITVAFGARMATCGGSSSTSSYSSDRLYRYDPREQAGLIPDVDTIDLATLDTFSVGGTDSEQRKHDQKIFALQDQMRELDERRLALRVLRRELNEVYPQAAQLDSQVVAAGTSDEDKGVAERAALIWVRLHRGHWNRFDSLYTSYTADVAKFNRDVVKINKVGKFRSSSEPLETITIEEDLQTAHAEHKRIVAKWGKRYRD